MEAGVAGINRASQRVRRARWRQTGSTLPAPTGLGCPRVGVDRRGQARSSGGGRVRNRRSVTRRRRSLTGQLVGQCSLIRSLYATTRTASLNNLRITVTGWALASSVWTSTSVRSA